MIGKGEKVGRDRETWLWVGWKMGENQEEIGNTSTDEWVGYPEKLFILKNTINLIFILF